MARNLKPAQLQTNSSVQLSLDNDDTSVSPPPDFCISLHDEPANPTTQLDGLFTNRRCLCIVTGASRGLGRACVRAIAAEIATHSLHPGGMLLISRDSEAILETRRIALATNPNLTVVPCQMDLGKADHNEMKSTLGNLLSAHFGVPQPSEGPSNMTSTDDEPPSRASTMETPWDLVILVHNAGTLGDISKTALQHTDTRILSRFTYTNMVSPFALTGILHTLLMLKMPEALNPLRVIVNISSLAAVKPFPTWSAYCASKAARDLYFACLARERPDYRVLNYAPGPLDTAMQAEVRSSCGDPALRDQFMELKASNKLVDPDQSAVRMARFLHRNDFVSGQHVDYYDITN